MDRNRAGQSGQGATLTGWAFGDFVLDEGGRRLIVDGTASHLPPKEFQLLCLLAKSGGAILTRDQLMNTLWPHEEVSDAALAKTVQKIRHRLGSAGDEVVRTIYKVGYQLVPPARELGTPESRPSPMAAGDLQAISSALLRMATHLDLLPLPAIRSTLEIAATCCRGGRHAEMKVVFAAAAARLKVTHGDQFALTQLAEYYLAECTTLLGEPTGLSFCILHRLRPEALAHAEPGAEWGARLARLRARVASAGASGDVQSAA